MSQEEEVLQRYYASMRRGAEAEAELLALFAEDAVYREPFSGKGEVVGRDAIRSRFREGWETPLPGMELDVLAVDVTPGSAEVSWECRADVFPGPQRGRDRYRIVDGLIAELDVVLDDPG